MLVVFILKVKLLHKDESEQLASICKTTYLYWNSVYDGIYIIPTISFQIDSKSLEITFKWLRIVYSHYWRIITDEEESMYISAITNKDKQTT